MFNDPNIVELDRKTKEGLVWGLGTHFCLGAPLARLEMLEALLSKTEHFELVGNKRQRAVYPSNGFVKLFLHLHKINKEKFVIKAK